MNDSEKEKCKKQTRTCKSCEGKDCNKKKEFQKCIFCNSKENRECSSNTTITWLPCENYLSTCLTGIDAHGVTHRRCSKDTEQDMQEFPHINWIQVCLENLCNKNMFPSDRLQCYDCNGEDDCDFMENTDDSSFRMARVLKPCAVLLKNDECYAYLGNGKFVNEHLYMYKFWS